LKIGENLAELQARVKWTRSSHFFYITLYMSWTSIS